ncbi:MAG: hypothetical protein NVSMB5_12220 [Candidatus Velthaea sp.]
MLRELIAIRKFERTAAGEERRNFGAQMPHYRLAGKHAADARLPVRIASHVRISHCRSIRRKAAAAPTEGSDLPGVTMRWAPAGRRNEVARDP